MGDQGGGAQIHAGQKLLGEGELAVGGGRVGEGQGECTVGLAVAALTGDTVVLGSCSRLGRCPGLLLGRVLSDGGEESGVFSACVLTHACRAMARPRQWSRVYTAWHERHLEVRLAPLPSGYIHSAPFAPGAHCYRAHAQRRGHGVQRGARDVFAAPRFELILLIAIEGKQGWGRRCQPVPAVAVVDFGVLVRMRECDLVAYNPG
ncbi:hypothetical protein ACFW5I_29090 [Streptomyces sp. NPDC058818]|uniref:hypothetical protein n=1 Tax=Streptomyces sp. NPDC058818 TaxID=3346640 RepID=UPI00367C1E57